MIEPMDNNSAYQDTAANNLPADETAQMTPAPFLSRLAAILIDVCLLFVINAAFFILPAVAGWHYATFEPHAILLGVAILPLLPLLFPPLLSLAYYTILHAFGGQTVGMIFLGIRVVTTENESLSLGVSFLRWCAHFLSILTLGLGYLWALADPSKATLHDRIAASRVVMI